MRFYLKSINKYWVDQYADIEIIITCLKEKAIGQFHTYPYADTILIAIPLIKIETLSPNSFLVALSTALKNSQSSFNYEIFDFDQVFLEADELNQSTQFYFYNANNPFQCDIPQSTWLILNNYIKIPTSMLLIYEKYYLRIID